MVDSAAVDSAAIDTAAVETMDATEAILLRREREEKLHGEIKDESHRR